MPRPTITQGTILKGDRVRLRDRFLESTGQFTDHDRGPDAPCHWGYNARGTVTFRANGSRLVDVEWDDGFRTKTLASHLTKIGGDA